MQLPSPVSLQGRWEVAMCEMQFPKTWKNLPTDDNEICLKLHLTVVAGKQIAVWQTGRIPKGHYDSVKKLMGAIKQAIRGIQSRMELTRHTLQMNVHLAQLLKTKSGGRSAHLFTKQRLKYKTFGEMMQDPFSLIEQVMIRQVPIIALSENEIETVRILERNLKREREEVAQLTVNDILNMPEGRVEKALKHSFVKDTHQLKLEIDGETIKAIQFPEKIQYMLGLTKSLLEPGTHIVNYAPDFTGGFTTLYVHCSIVEPQTVGNFRSELLRTVPVDSEKKFGETIHKEFISPHYVNVLHKNFDNIRIEIRNDEGLPVPFEYGKVIVKLHFRKSKGL